MPRFSHQTRPGPASRFARQSDDSFFADFGRGTSSTYGEAEDAEDAEDFEQFFAERAGEDSEAEWAPAEAPDAPPTVTQGANKDEIIVTRADGKRYHVRRRIRAQVLTNPGRLRTGFCSDDKRVFFRLRWCEGTQGTIDLGANPQAAVKDLLEKVFKQIGERAQPDEIKKTLENASIQTFLSVDITKVDKWTITGDIKLDFNRTGLTSTAARISADAGWIKLGAEAKVGADGKQVLVTVEIPLGKRTIKGKPCPVRELAVWWDVECLREVPITIPLNLKPLRDYTEKHEQLFLYFDYSNTTLRRDPNTGPVPADEAGAILKSDPTIGTARLNKRALQRLDYLVGQGYWLSSVAGYASPEGRRPGPKPTDRGLAAKWEGNDALSLERAEKIRTLIGSRYVLMWFPPDKKMPQAVGKSENPTLNTKLGKELEGAALDRAMINGDPALNVKPFLDDHPEELARMTTEDQAFINDKRNSLRQRAERLFENLRRVEVHLSHREKLPPQTLQTYWLETESNCPSDVVDAAERQWGSRVPFTKRDPPVCF